MTFSDDLGELLNPLLPALSLSEGLTAMFERTDCLNRHGILTLAPGLREALHECITNVLPL